MFERSFLPSKHLRGLPYLFQENPIEMKYHSLSVLNCSQHHKGYFAHAQARQLSKFENPQMLLYESPSIACLNQNNAAKEQLFHLGNPRGHKLFQHDLVISSHLPFSNLTYR